MIFGTIAIDSLGGELGVLCRIHDHDDHDHMHMIMIICYALLQVEGASGASLGYIFRSPDLYALSDLDACACAHVPVPI